MEPRVTHKDITLGETTYRIKKMDPRGACWLFASLAAKAPDGKGLLSALGYLSHSEFDDVQATVLSFVSSLSPVDGLPAAIFFPDGKWADKSLSEDAGSVFTLTSEAILFNCSPFLVGSKSSEQQG